MFQHHASSSSLKPPSKRSDPVDLNILTHPSRTPSLPTFTALGDGSTLPDRGQGPSRTHSNGATSETKESRPRTAEDRSADSVLQNFKVSLDDPCSKVLPAALKKYRITDDWRMYALFICYGTTGKRRVLL